MSEFRHITFNPTVLKSLDAVCKQLEAENYSLLRVVFWHNEEAVAVFERASLTETMERGWPEPD